MMIENLRKVKAIGDPCVLTCKVEILSFPESSTLSIAEAVGLDVIRDKRDASIMDVDEALLKFVTGCFTLSFFVALF